MSDHPALRRHRVRGAALVASLSLATVLAGCAQPGTQVPMSQAAKLGVGTSDISAACGYVEELMAFGPRHGKALASIKSMAQTGAQNLAGVYAQNQTDIYQGDSIGALLGDSIALLHGCRLTGPERILERALRAHG
jgi:hypothetical protein